MNGVWTQVQKIVASDRAANDYFGRSVSISGNYIVVGAYNEDENVAGLDTQAEAGSAYIYEQNLNGDWIEVQKIVASDRAASDLFGNAVSISGDYIAVGAFLEDEDELGENTLSGAGSVYIYERVDGVWTQVQKIVSSDRAANDSFGNAVSISGDYIVIAAHGEDEDITGGNTFSNAGSVYIYNKNNSLGIEGLEFTGFTEEVTNELYWSVIEEEDIKEYNVERSQDGFQYEVIGTVLPKQGHTKEYTFTDEFPLEGTNYYRLKIVEESEEYSYSGIISLEKTVIIKEFSISTYPNPASVFTLEIITLSNKKVSIALFDILGKKLQQYTESIQGRYKKEISLEKQPAGIYYLEIKADQEVFTKKIVKN